MKFDPDNHHRRSIRLRNYDYAQAGAYFVTLCIQYGECLLGRMEDGEMRLNDAGYMIARWWDELNRKFPTLCTDVFVIMPNHFHGIIVIESDDQWLDGENGQSHDGQPRRAAPTDPGDGVGAVLGDRPGEGPPHDGPPHRIAPTDSGDGVGAVLGDCPGEGPPHEGPPHRAAPTGGMVAKLGDVIRWFKTMSTNEYIRGVKQQDWPPFPGKLWQRNYYERVIRNKRELTAIRQYVVENPLKWHLDRENPDVAEM